MSWKEIAQHKRNTVNNQIPPQWRLDIIPSPEEQPNAGKYLDQILPQKEVEITSSTAIELLTQISNGQLSAVDVTTAFCHRSALIHQLCNCCSEIFFDRALERAHDLDKIFKTTGKTVGRLHGLPISLKDQVNIVGLDSAMGFVSKVNHPITEENESLLAQILYKEGAVFFIKTTTPTSMMSGDCYSHIYGYTVNSVNRKASCGGSSGGEGAIVGARGAVIGFGTDIGGSIRFPSGHQGLFGLKPSTSRFPYLNVSNTMADNPLIASVIGPMCTNIDDLDMISKVVLDNKPWLLDSKVPPIEWKSSMELPSKVKVGLIVEKGDIKFQPAVQRTLAEFSDKLTRQGHVVVPLEDKDLPVRYSYMGEVSGKLYQVNGYADIKQAFADADEPIVDFLSYIKDIQPMTVEKEWEVNKKKYYYTNVFNKFMIDNGFDCLIAPISGGCFTPGNVNFNLNACNIYNMFDYSSLAIPGLKVKSTDVYAEDYVPTNLINQEVYENFDIEALQGTPIGLQIVCGKYQEEKCIGLYRMFNREV